VTITQTKERPLVTRPAPPAKEAFTR
jgi:hypothetical protein